MDPSDFNANSPGRLVPCRFAGRDSNAFVPNLLPAVLDFPLKIWRLVGDAKEQLGILEGVGRILPNPDLLLRPLSKFEAIKSSSIEGTYATPKELLMYERSPMDRVREEDKENDWRQVLNYSDALSFGMRAFEQRGIFTLGMIREMHQILLRDVRGSEKHPGQWRPNQVIIGWPPTFIPPPRYEVEPLLENFIEYLNGASSEEYLLKAFMAHYQFETIHPFSDGNGRIGRLLLSLSIQAWSPMTKPWLFLSHYFEANKSDYMGLLLKVSTKNAWIEWLEYCLVGTVVSAKAILYKVEALRKLQIEFQDKMREAGGSVRLALLADQLFISPLIDAPQAKKFLQVSLPTARHDLHKLKSMGILEELEGKRPITYYAPDVFRVAYEE